MFICNCGIHWPLSTEATDAFILAELPLPGAKPPLLGRRRTSAIRRKQPMPIGRNRLDADRHDPVDECLIWSR
jgi:hypothetical protein